MEGGMEGERVLRGEKNHPPHQKKENPLPPNTKPLSSFLYQP